MNNYKAKGCKYQDAVTQVTQEPRQGLLTQIWKHREGGIFQHPQLSRPGSHWNITSLPLMKIFEQAGSSDGWANVKGV